MVIYIEQSLFENFIIDFLLLKLSLIMFKYKTKYYKILIASLLGAIISIFAPLITSLLSVLLKLILSTIMILIILPKSSLKMFSSLYFSFLGFTFLFGGAAYALNSAASVYFQKDINIPFFLLLVAFILLFYMVAHLFKKIYNRKSNIKFEYNVTLISENSKIKTNAFLDSGNKLTYNLSPVILIDSLTFLKLYPKDSLCDVLLKKTQNLSMKNTHILNINNINNSKSSLVVFSLPKLIIEDFKEINNVCCAITLKKFNLETPTSCLLNPLLF